MPLFQFPRLSIVRALSCCAWLWCAACDSGPTGTYSGTTELQIFHDVSDEHPYKEQHDDAITIEELDNGNLAVEWLGCRLIADYAGKTSSELLPGTCEIDLEDGRTALLTVGWPHEVNALGTTVAVLYDDPAQINVVARLLIDGRVYNPSYMFFTAD